MDPIRTIDELKTYDVKQMAEFYFNLSDISVINISIDLFFILLKLHDIEVSEENRKVIIVEIDKINECKKLEEYYKTILEEELQKQVKKLSLEFEQQKDELKKQMKDKQEQIKNLEENLKTAQSKIQYYEQITDEERKKLEDEWFYAYKTQVEELRKSDELQRKKEIADAENSYRELILVLESEVEKKRIELETKYLEKRKKEKEVFISNQEKYNLQIEGLQMKKKLLDERIEYLEQRVWELDNNLQNMYDAEQNYFATFEQRILERKIDTLLLKKFGIEEKEQISCQLVSNTKFEESSIVKVAAKKITYNMEYSESIECIEDFVDDYRINIGLNFENEMEIASLVIASLMNRKAIVASNKSCSYIAEALSALLELSTPLILNVTYEKESLKELVEIIEASSSQVICVKGILDNYNETFLIQLCEICRNKYLFFPMSELDNLKLMSKAIMDYVVIIDADSCLRFPLEDSILINDYNVKTYFPKLDISKSRKIYNQIFNRFVQDGNLRKVTALEYSNLLQYYFILIDGREIGSVAQKSILYAGNFETADEKVKEELNKIGINSR